MHAVRVYVGAEEDLERERRRQSAVARSDDDMVVVVVRRRMARMRVAGSRQTMLGQV